MAAARNLGLGWFRDSRAEGTVWASAIVMDRPFTKNAAYVAFSQRNEVVQTLPADRANKPFAKRIGCWTANRSFQDADAETGEFMVQAHGEDGIPVVNEKSVRMVAGQCLAELLERPCRCRMIGDVHMKQAARADLHGNEHIQDSETGSDHSEEVTGDNRFRVIADERGPALRGGASWTARAAKIFVNRARRDKYAEFQGELVGDPFLAPRRVFPRHLPHERTNIPRQGGTSTSARLPPPKQTESGTMPANESLRFDDDERISPIEKLRHPDQCQFAPSRRAANFRLTLPIQRELAAQEQDLGEKANARQEEEADDRKQLPIVIVETVGFLCG